MLGGRSRTTRQIENEIDQVGAGRRCGMGTEVCDSDSAASHATVVPGAGPRGGAMVQGPSKGRTVSPWPRMIPRGTPTAQEQFRCEANRMLTIGARKSRCWRVGGWAGVCVLWPGPCAPGRCRSGSPFNFCGPGRRGAFQGLAGAGEHVAPTGLRGRQSPGLMPRRSCGGYEPEATRFGRKRDPPSVRE